MSRYCIITLAGSDPDLNPYLAMIYSDWLRSLKYGNEWFKLIESDRFFEVYRQVINQLLNRSTVRLALLSDDLDICLGWSISSEDSLHYVFVKKDIRRQGVGKSLMPKEFKKVTHLTKIGQAIRKDKFPNTIFDPFLT